MDKLENKQSKGLVLKSKESYSRRNAVENQGFLREESMVRWGRVRKDNVGLKS